MFEDKDMKHKKTAEAKMHEETLTILEADQLLGKSKDEMKMYVESKRLTKVKIERNFFRYLLLKRKIEKLLK